MNSPAYRQAIADYIRDQARPVDKYSHQPRLYATARQLGQGQTYDDDVLYAASWLHDLGVFIGHRPDDLAALAKWDNVAYAVKQVPNLLKIFGFPEDKIPAVVEIIQTHLPANQPTSLEGQLLHDADILEQLGAIGIVRQISKVGRDSRYSTHGLAVAVLHRNLRELPQKLTLATAKQAAQAKLQLLATFLEALETETLGVEL